MREQEIRNRAAYDRYLELVLRDAEALLKRYDRFVRVACPVCGNETGDFAFSKQGFEYECCSACQTLFVNPRPRFEDLADIYRDSESTRFWVEEFFAPVAEARREKIFRPRAEHVTQVFPEFSLGRIGDIGAGFGLFLGELNQLWPGATMVAIEPSSNMAERCRAMRLDVIESMLEEIEDSDAGFDMLCAFELFEHLFDPLSFLQSAHRLLNPGGILLFTTLNGLGFDIQLHWDRSKSVSPPHHLNFANPFTINRLLERAAFELLDASTPGVLDWDIVERAWIDEGVDPGRLMRSVSTFGTSEAKEALQEWITTHRFSSHMRVIARKAAK